MKIKEINIEKYGPLSDFKIKNLANFTLVWGKNEQGKTLTIEAIIKLLFNDIKSFYQRLQPSKNLNKTDKNEKQKLQRVKYTPAGYIILNTKQGEVKIPDSKIDKLKEIGTYHYKNIFIIRNSDLIVEDGFYTTITDKLTGIEIKEIEKLIKKTYMKWKLSYKTKEFIQNRKMEYNNVKEIIKKVKDLSYEIETNGLEELELRKIKDENNLEKLDKTIKIKLYQQLQDNIKILEKNIEYLENLKSCNYKDRNKWSKAEINIQNAEKELKRNEQELSDIKEKIKDKKQKPSEKTMKIIFIISLIILPLMFISGILFNYNISYILSGILFLIGTASYFKYQSKKERIYDFNQRIKEIDQTIKPNQEKIIEDNKQTIEEIKNKTDIKTIEDYEKKMGEKQEKEKGKIGIQTRVESLFENFEPKGNIIGKDFSIIKKMFNKIEKPDSLETEHKYSDMNIQELKTEKNNLGEKIDEYNEELEELKINFYNISTQVANLNIENKLCESYADLKKIKKDLETLIKKHNVVKDRTLIITEILEGIKQEKEGEISKIFGKDSLVSKYFKYITGNYEEVNYDKNKEAGKITVKDNKGNYFSPNQISSGTYDQLYLSIRLAFANKLLNGEKGFFIMDDPFIKADTERLKKQLHILKKMSENGWQILYFSAKGEIRDALKNDIENHTINYIEIKNDIL